VIKRRAATVDASYEASGGQFRERCEPGRFKACWLITGPRRI
jgi:hypothetical protein